MRIFKIGNKVKIIKKRYNKNLFWTNKMNKCLFEIGEIINIKEINNIFYYQVYIKNINKNYYFMKESLIDIRKDKIKRILIN